MNERIKVLWEQAGGHYDGGNQHTWPQYTIDNPEKFAELIANDCAALCDLYAMPDGTSETAIILAAAIRRKFGIEQ